MSQYASSLRLPWSVLIRSKAILVLSGGDKLPEHPVMRAALWGAVTAGEGPREPVALLFFLAVRCS